MSKAYNILVKDKPKWFQWRWKLSNLLMGFARWVYPENPEVMAFLVKTVTDAMIYGNSITNVDVKSFLNNQEEAQ